MDLFTSMIRKCRRRLLLLVVGFLLFELISGHRINSDYDSNELSQQCGKVSRADYRCGYVHSRRQSSDEELEANDEDDDSDQFISLNPNSPAGSWRCKRQMSLAFLANPTNSCSIDCLTTLTSSYNESSGRMTVTNQTNGSQNESTIYCARARNSCGATIPVYLYSLENTGSQFVGETDDLRGKRCKKGTQPLCFAWPFNEDKDNKSRNPTNQMYPRTSIRRRRQVTDDYSSTTVASSTTGQSSTTSVPTTSTGTTTVGTSVASSTTGQSSTTSVSTTTTGTTTVGTSTVLSSTVSTTGEITTVPTTTVVTTALTTLPTTASVRVSTSTSTSISSSKTSTSSTRVSTSKSTQTSTITSTSKSTRTSTSTLKPSTSSARVSTRTSTNPSTQTSTIKSTRTSTFSSTSTKVFLTSTLPPTSSSKTSLTPSTKLSTTKTSLTSSTRVSSTQRSSSTRSSSSSPRSSSLTSTQSSTRSSSTVSSSTLSSSTPKTTQSSFPSSTSSSTQRSSTSNSSSTISTPKTTQSSNVWSTTTRLYYSSSYAWNSRSSPTSWSWMALAQRLCSLNVSANYLYSSDLPTTIAQLGVQLNLTTAEINEIIQLVQSLNISQSDIANILSSCQNGGSNGNGGQIPSNDWGTGGGWIGGQIPNWQQGDYDSSNEGNLWPRRGWWSRRKMDEGINWRGRGPMRLGLHSDGGFQTQMPNETPIQNNENRTFDLQLIARRQRVEPSRWRSTTTAWPPSSSTTNYNNTYSSSLISSTTSRYRSNSTDPNNNDYWNGDYGNWNNWNDYDNDNWWNGNRRKVWRWVVLGVCCGIILLLALSILCIAFYRPRVQHRVIVTPYNNQLYTKDARAAEPPPVPISPLESYPEVRY